MGRSFTDLTPESLDKLQSYTCPGNVRELQNVLERAAILAEGPIVSIADALIEPVPIPQIGAAPGDVTPMETCADPKPRRLDEAERRHIEGVLGETGWTIEGAQGAAAILGIAPSRLRSRMKKLGVKRP